MYNQNMERPEIVSGLKNAVERGYSIELAVQSFVNAGYNRQDVADSARIISGGTLSSLEPVIQQPDSAKIQIPQNQQPVKQDLQSQPPAIQPAPQIQQIKRQELPKLPQVQKSKKKMIILLVTILVVLLVLLGGVIVFKDSIIKLFSGS